MSPRAMMHLNPTLTRLLLMTGSATTACLALSSPARSGSRNPEPVHAPREELLVRYEGDAQPFRTEAVRPGWTPANAARSARMRPKVLHASLNRYHCLLSVPPPPNDPLWPAQWNFRREVEGAARIWDAWYLLHRRGRLPGAGARVAVVDSGAAFEDYLRPAGDGTLRRFARAPDFEGTSFIFPYHVLRGDSHPNDEVNHGTHIAGTIAAGYYDSIGAAGIAPYAAIIPVNASEILPNGVVLPESAIALGIRWAADHGAHVINMSFGSPAGSEVLADAVSYARKKGCLLVAATGNEASRHPFYPAAFDVEVLGVTALRQDGRLAEYSTHGPGTGISAPGGSLFNDQDRDNRLDGISQQSFSYLGDPTQFEEQSLEGTSMACAHVSGVAALLAGVRPRNGAELRGLLLRTSRPAAHRFLWRTYSERYGWGRLDAGAAVRAADEPMGRPDRVLRVEAVQLFVRQRGHRWAAEVKVKVSDSQFRPVPRARVKLLIQRQPFMAIAEAVTDGSGVAEVTVGRFTARGGERLSALVLGVSREGALLQRGLSAELRDTALVPDS